MRRRILWGLAALGAYLVAGIQAVGTLPGRPLYDGLEPPPAYRWVQPPDRAGGNRAPAEALDRLPFEGAGTAARGVTTSDGQASITAPRNAFSRQGQAGFVAIEIVPLDPQKVGPPPPGLEFDGNAYRFVARYEGASEEAEPGTPVTVVLRYSTEATRLLRWGAGGWVSLPAKTVPAAFQILGQSETMGAFVAAREPSTGLDLLLPSSIAAAFGGAVIGLAARRRTARPILSGAEPRG